MTLTVKTELQELLTYFLTFLNDGNSNANLGSIANSTEIARSQGCVNLVRNLKDWHAVFRFWNAQHNLEIVQIPRLRGTYIYTAMVVTNSMETIRCPVCHICSSFTAHLKPNNKVDEPWHSSNGGVGELFQSTRTVLPALDLLNNHKVTYMIITTCLMCCLQN